VLSKSLLAFSALAIFVKLNMIDKLCNTGATMVLTF